MDYQEHQKPKCRPQKSQELAELGLYALLEYLKEKRELRAFRQEQGV